MNNIFLNQDPLLSSGLNTGYKMPYPQMSSIPQPQYIPQIEHDSIDELESLMKNSSEDVLNNINNDEEWMRLNGELSAYVHKELMYLIKSRLNTNPNVVTNVKKQIEIIKNADRRQKDLERQNINELNEYMKNYSHLTFDEYKKLKNDENGRN